MASVLSRVDSGVTTRHLVVDQSKVKAMKTVTFESLMRDIGTLAGAEKITKAKLASLSRDLLFYMVSGEGGDVRPINALLGKDEGGNFILTPLNRKVAGMYFLEFLPFTSNREDIKGKDDQPLVFKSKSKKKWDKGVQTIREWLDDEGNDVWTWAKTNVKVEKETDYAKKVQSAIRSAINEEKGGMSLHDVVGAIIAMDEISAYDLIAAMESFRVDKAA